jgi:hypothetical protein
VRIALAWKGIEYDLKYIDMGEDEQVKKQYTFIFFLLENKGDE